MSFYTLDFNALDPTDDIQSPICDRLSMIKTRMLACFHQKYLTPSNGLDQSFRTDQWMWFNNDFWPWKVEFDKKIKLKLNNLK